jgi:hypothetical protein
LEGVIATFLRRVDGELAVIVPLQPDKRTQQAHGPADRVVLRPGLSYAHAAGIREKSPEVTQLVRSVLIDAQQGKADAKAFAEASRIAFFVRRVGLRFLGPRGGLKALVLLEQNDDPSRRTFIYRVQFEKSTIVWSFTLDRDGKILGLEPLEE